MTRVFLVEDWSQETVGAGSICSPKLMWNQKVACNEAMKQIVDDYQNNRLLI